MQGTVAPSALHITTECMDKGCKMTQNDATGSLWQGDRHVSTESGETQRILNLFGHSELRVCAKYLR